jgi:hypothetical protein
VRIAVVFTVVTLIALLALYVHREQHGFVCPPPTDADRAEDAYVAGIMGEDYMRAFDVRRIREQNRYEKLQFGDGSNAPFYPREASNGSYTLRRGVWVSDWLNPSNRELDRFREAHRTK